MKTLFLTALLALLATAVPIAGHAQLAVQQAPQSDSVVAIAADAMGLPFVPAEERPFFGTFWQVRSTFPSVAAPSPCPPLDPSIPVYAMTDHQFLVDQTDGRPLATTSAYARRKFAGMDPASIQAAWLKEIEAFIAEVQERQAAVDLRRSIGMDDLDDSGGGLLLGLLEYTADDLWLEISALTNSVGFFTIHPPTTELTNGVYDLYMTTNLSPVVVGLNLTNWTWLLRSDPGQTNLLVPDLTDDQAFFILGRTNDADGDMMSDAYEHLVSHTSPTNPDAPIITLQPLSQTVYSGDTVSFTVAAEGAQPLTYQWFLNASPITSETNTSLTLVNVQTSQAGDYSVQVTSPSSLSTLSSNATLSVPLSEYGDFIWLIGPRQDFTFRNGVTYLVNSRVELFGTTTIQGGCVVKPDWHYTNSTVAVIGNLVCKMDDPNLPAFFTSVDDDSLGQVINISTGFPEMYSNGCPYLDLSAAQIPSSGLANLRVCFADQGITTSDSSKRLDLWHSQFLQCNAPVWAGQDSSVAFHNVLLGACNTAVAAPTNFAGIAAEQLTAEVSTLWAAPTPPAWIRLTNSIVTGSIASGSALVTDHVAINPAGPIFQTNGTANYYLAPLSPLRAAGTPNISARLQSDLHQKTTRPPLTFPQQMEVTGDITLRPQAARYTTGAPDYGYHYQALDYTVAWMKLRGRITVLPGTTIGFRQELVPGQSYTTAYGFDLKEGSAFMSHGTPAKPITFIDVQYIQEQATTPCLLLFAPDFTPPDLSGTDDPPPSLDFRFSNFYTVPRNYVLWSGVSEQTWDIQASLDSAMFWSMRDCNIHGGNITVGPPDWYWMPLNYLYGEGSISWVNNLFDQVAVFLDPTYYPSGYNDLGLNVDMSFSAYNNLFRGGGWFHLESIPATAGNWVFSDNLFEKVHFVQNTNMPLDYGHNAYWQLTETELSAWGWGTNHLLAATNGAGTGELLLAASLRYQSGPLGDYYLPITTPLYHAGSRTPAEAGLVHYTTRVDQLKAGEEPGTHNASIGLHYLSTINGAPKDADTDGISDYLENWHGDGSYSSHIDTETDWQVSFTISGVYDPTNAIYDDRDLSGSGLVGAVKKVLSLAPFDIANPLTLLGLDPAQPVLGECAFPLLLTDHSNAAGALILYADGQQAETGEVRQATNAKWFAFWDTTTLANSHHSLQVGYSYISASGIQRTVYGPLALPQISNPITFDPINDGFSSVLYIRGTLKQPVSAYTIDIYSDDSQHTLLATITNTPVGNTIEDSWDFTAQGTNVDSGLVTEMSFPLDPQVPQPIVKHYSMERCFPGNSFTLAWAWDTSNATYLASREQIVRMGLVDMLGTDLNGLEFDLLPAGPGGNVPYASSFQLDGSASAHDRLLYSIADTGSLNFFFWGHGFRNGFTSDRNDPYPPSALRADEIANLTGNPGGTNTGSVYRHPYRFVFMDACGSYSRQMVRAFGIPFAKNGSTSTVADYLQWGRLPRAFIGWDVTIIGSDITDELSDLYRVTAQQIVLGHWQAGGSLQSAMAAWDAYLPDKRFSSLGQLYRDVDPNTPDITVTPARPLGIYPPMRTWKLSGCKDLTRYSPIP